MIKIYPTAQECEQAMVPSTKKIAPYGQQIFAQCTSIHTNLHKQTVKLIWSVTKRGNFLLKSQNINDEMPKSHEADV